MHRLCRLLNVAPLESVHFDDVIALAALPPLRLYVDNQVLPVAHLQRKYLFLRSPLHQHPPKPKPRKSYSPINEPPYSIAHRKHGRPLPPRKPLRPTTLPTLHPLQLRPPIQRSILLQPQRRPHHPPPLRLRPLPPIPLLSIPHPTKQRLPRPLLAIAPPPPLPQPPPPFPRPGPLALKRPLTLSLKLPRQGMGQRGCGGGGGGPVGEGAGAREVGYVGGVGGGGVWGA